jgi:hypothetical protein
MDKSPERKVSIPILSVLVFIIVTAICIFLKPRLAQKNIDTNVVLGGNILLFLLTLLSSFMHARALKDPNPNAFVRSVMSAMIMKLFAIAAGVLIYLFLAGKDKNVAGIVICMGLYIVYTAIEVKGTSTLNKKNTNGD